MPAACRPSVSIIPGLTALTRILRGPSSWASERVMAFTAALVALYTDVFGGADVAANVLGPGNVGLHGNGLAVRLPDALDDRLRAGLAAGVIDHDRRPGCRQVLGNRCTDAFRRTRDHGDLPLQFLRHDRTPFRLDRSEA